MRKNPIEVSREEIDAFFDRQGNITVDNYLELQSILNRERLCEVLGQIMTDDEAADRIAERSYVHSQGFSKIILIDGKSEGNNGTGGKDYKHRLHLWRRRKARADGAPIVEMKHAHKWGFVSYLPVGEVEDHWYEIRDLSEGERAVFEKFEAALRNMSAVEIAAICERIDLIETIALASTSSVLPMLQGGMDAILRQSNLKDLEAVLNLTHEELNLIVNILVKYSNQRTPEGTEVYRHEGARFFAPTKLVTHQQGSFRMHPIDSAHRLIVDPKRYVATNVITGIPHAGRKPGEFVRASVGKVDGDQRERVYYTRQTLRGDLEECISEILATPA